jgi:hypothetical protein
VRGIGQKGAHPLFGRSSCRYCSLESIHHGIERVTQTPNFIMGVLQFGALLQVAGSNGTGSISDSPKRT